MYVEKTVTREVKRKKTERLIKMLQGRIKDLSSAIELETSVRRKRIFQETLGLNKSLLKDAEENYIALGGRR